MAFKCIVAMVKPSLTDKVVDAAKKVGSSGATIITASGTGKHEAKSFFGLSIDVRTDIILFVVQDDNVDLVLSAIERGGRFSEPGTGIAFVVPVEKAVGMQSQLSAQQ